jgi:hypothetical protein
MSNMKQKHSYVDRGRAQANYLNSQPLKNPVSPGWGMENPTQPWHLSETLPRGVLPMMPSSHQPYRLHSIHRLRSK